LTLRELFIALGYQIDETSEKKAEQGIKSLITVPVFVNGNFAL